MYCYLVQFPFDQKKKQIIQYQKEIALEKELKLQITVKFHHRV